LDVVKSGKLRVGIISANWGAAAHLPAWRTLSEDVEVTAICTSRQETAETAAEQFDVARPFWSYEAMCADPDIDIIDVGTNPVLRAKMVTAALNAGKHVINQMPFAESYEAAAQLEALRAAKAVMGGAATSLLGLPHLWLMKEMIDAGEIGEVFQVQCDWQMSFFLEISPGFPYTWFGKSGLGVSVTRNNGSHMLHALRHLFGTITSTAAQLKTQLKTWELPDGEILNVETDDTCHALLAFDSGAMGTLSTSWTAADSPGFYIEAFGSKGRLRLSALRYPSIDSATLYAAKNARNHLPSGSQVPVPDRLMTVAGHLVEHGPADLMNGGQRVSLARLFERFVKAIHGDGEPLPSFARAAEIQGLIAALHAADARKSWVDTADYSL
jgi:predicted dehydrogenase